MTTTTSHQPQKRTPDMKIAVAIALVAFIIFSGVFALLRTADRAEKISDALKDTYGITVTDYEAVSIQTGRQTVVTGKDGEQMHITLSAADDADAPPVFTVGTPLEK